MAAVAISTVGGTSVGYGGTMTEDNMSTWAVVTGGAQYGVSGPDDWRATPVAAGDRLVQIEKGRGFAFGVFDETPAAAQIQLATQPSGSRYDVVVARRNWAGAGGITSFDAITATAAGDLPASRAKRMPAGLPVNTTDEQPLAIFKVTAGQSVPELVADLRVWHANGGAFARSEKVLQYLDAPGTSVLIGQDRWHRVVSSTGVESWSMSKEYGADLFGTGSPIAGVIDGSSRFKIQAGSIINVSDTAGWSRVTFPTPFPNGLLAFLVTNGDDVAANDVTMAPGSVPWGVGSKTDVVYRIWGPTGAGRAVLAGFRHRANWLAIGW